MVLCKVWGVLLDVNVEVGMGFGVFGEYRGFVRGREFERGVVVEFRVRVVFIVVRECV